MGDLFNVYCDESCHLPLDRQKSMVLGAVWLPKVSARDFNSRIRALKLEHGLAGHVELKWVRVSARTLPLYKALVDLFFASPELRFRALIVPDKSILDHERFGQDHDTWYYKMYFSLLKGVLDRTSRFRIVLDIKDTRSADKMRKLHDVLCSSMYDFDRSIVESLDAYRSDEIQLLQLADVLIGAVSYANRGLGTSPAKVELLTYIRARSGLRLTNSTFLSERKFNLFRWEPREGNAS
jgi:hypothetical protein